MPVILSLVTSVYMVNSTVTVKDTFPELVITDIGTSEPCVIEDGTLIWTVNGTVCGAPEEAVATGVTPEELPELPGVLVAAGLLLDEDEGEGVEVPVAPLFPTVTGFVVPLFPIVLFDDGTVPLVPGVLLLPLLPATWCLDVAPGVSAAELPCAICAP